MTENESVQPATTITQDQIAKWRARKGEGLISEVGQYTPDEFWLVLDELERLQAPAVGAAVPPGWQESLNDALVRESERAIEQRDQFLKTGVSTAGHGGSHDTCFPAIIRQHVAMLAPAVGAGGVQSDVRQEFDDWWNDQKGHEKGRWTGADDAAFFPYKAWKEATRRATAAPPLPAAPDVKYALAHADIAAYLLMRAHERAPETWRGWYDDALVHIDIARKALAALAQPSAPLPAAKGQEPADAEEAKRYRWLREQHEGDDAEETCCIFAPNDMQECLVPVGSLPGELDAFIDAALASQQPTEQGG